MGVLVVPVTRQTYPATTDGCGRARSGNGFTLVEVVVVIVIMAVAAAVVVPNMRAGARQREIRRALQGFVSAIRGASARAVVDRSRVELKLWPQDGAYALFVRASEEDQGQQEAERTVLAKVGGDERQQEPPVQSRVEAARFELPDSGAFGDVDGGRASAGEDAVVFDFYPSGASSGGRIEFVFDAGSNRRQAYLLEVNPLVSSISIEEIK